MPFLADIHFIGIIIEIPTAGLDRLIQVFLSDN